MHGEEGVGFRGTSMSHPPDLQSIFINSNPPPGLSTPSNAFSNSSSKSSSSNLVATAPLLAKHSTGIASSLSDTFLNYASIVPPKSSTPVPISSVNLSDTGTAVSGGLQANSYDKVAVFWDFEVSLEI